MRGDGPGAVVVGVDESPTSLRALDYAAGLARRQSGRLVVVHVRSLRPVGPGLDALAPVAVQAALEARQATEDDLRAEARRIAEQGDVEVTFVLRVGEPMRELSAVADQQHADVVVVGASTRPAHRLAGSLAARLVRSCGWPVTVVP
ncbi:MULTISPECIES: universal stress protein [Geodermatophilus]|uniref:Nucleotide-binding universal stress protein, UspA family n=1 Tax=Geodermatophilus nigrescens TaxID=1070870 RepID=A0A1M5I9M1_9ACTN|nr:universal stress protein [Geodermatophilus nigrescens]SHG24925.1 Nucleotide-binding universal stress protein, UspA family [Geodermatophilus nigrescens]